VFFIQQEIMEKFEFLPIKCRTERARQLYCKNNTAADNGQTAVGGKKPLKSKVCITLAFQ
jgi:hypothetical protein